MGHFWCFASWSRYIITVYPRLLYFKQSPLFHDSARSTLFPPVFDRSSSLEKKQIVCSFIDLFPSSWLCNCIQVTFILTIWTPSEIKHWFIMGFFGLFSHSCPLLFFSEIFRRRKGGGLPRLNSPFPTVF